VDLMQNEGPDGRSCDGDGYGVYNTMEEQRVVQVRSMGNGVGVGRNKLGLKVGGCYESLTMQMVVSVKVTGLGPGSDVICFCPRSTVHGPVS
jgi:hypothetical protein